MPFSVPQLTDFSPEALNHERDRLLQACDDECAAVSDDAQVRVFLDRWFGRKNGLVSSQIDEVWRKQASRENIPVSGALVNSVKKKLDPYKNLQSKSANGVVTKAQLEATRLLVLSPVSSSMMSHFEVVPDVGEGISTGGSAKVEIDITQPGTRRALGAEHPVMRTMHEIISVFRNLGYSIADGPEVETDFYNFEALNFPPNHPARDTQDTLFIAGQETKALRDRLLLRTHTSPVQIRTMMKQKPPVRVLCPGKVHRNDAADATHSPVFHQVEGLAVDTNITFCDLKGTLDHAMKMLFGSSVKTRFYPSFFPFTEPSADMQISCIFCGGKGQRDGGPCRNCKSSGWIELLGCGMVDPNVYGFVDYDATKVSGFAFGMGVERIAIMKYGVDDIQLFYNGDVRFLEQFA